MPKDYEVFQPMTNLKPQKPEPDSAEWWQQVAQGMQLDFQNLKAQQAKSQWTLDNIYTIARRELRRLERAGASEVESVPGDRWGHVVRLCEAAGCQGRGVLRDNGGAVEMS